MLDECLRLNATFCMPHQAVTDALLDRRAGIIRDLDTYTQLIRERGMVPGLSSHMPEAVVYADRQNADVETYIQIYNPIGFLCQVETDWVAKVINDTPKPIMCIKPLAAGRVLPTTGLSFVYNSIKPNDIVCIGTLSTYEAEDDIRISREILSQPAATQRELDFSRSKLGLV